ncbi:DUF4157 domain-containing protein [Streptomyces sp. TS71-3]|uniref:eCIS core domain-containing protein n=1 Tax=Streptomyces sp. TS71-3 TaxID=2733862 RepID=UPI001AFF4216|nr:DUF4157 domain-containing protein [Streptomyces sp. TS71-3]GHJ40871.1 hypothetical protein Sm713_64800 [Streptomyces sp. TS71-3]
MRTHSPAEAQGRQRQASAPGAGRSRGAAATQAAAGRGAAVPARLTPDALRALQRTAGNRAVTRMLRDARHRTAEPLQRAAAEEEAAAAQRSAVTGVLRGPGRPLPGALRTEMEARLGADFQDVRLHTGPAARASAAEVGAGAYTSGSHVVVGDGGADKHTLAHELTHVIQQRQGAVAGTDNGAGLSISHPADRFERAAEANAARVMARPRPGAPAAGSPRRPGTRPAEEEAEPPATARAAGHGTGHVQRRFAPFSGGTASAVDVATLAPLDTLFSNGLTYADGCTLGNSVNLEQLLRQTGGGSEPGYPEGFEEIRLVDQYLLWENRQQVSTAMHAINGDFVAGANNTAGNIFMGTAQANKTHLNEVEAPIRSAMQGTANRGVAVRYQNAMRTFQPQHPPGAPWIQMWDNPGADIPGTEAGGKKLPFVVDKGQKVTHHVDTGKPAENPKAFPRITRYSVVPTYVQGYLPPYILRNLANADQQIQDAKADLATLGQQTPRDQKKIDELADQIANEEDAVALLRANGPSLFPTRFTCTAEYWLASYDPSAPWTVSQESQVLDAQE